MIELRQNFANRRYIVLVRPFVRGVYPKHTCQIGIRTFYYDSSNRLASRFFRTDSAGNTQPFMVT